MYKQLSKIYYGGTFALLEQNEDNSFSFIGTTFICSNKGYLATCAHNINLNKANKLYINSIDTPLNEFTPLTYHKVNASPVELVQYDVNSDIALLKINSSSTFNAPDKFLLETKGVDVGSQCLYIGYPFGDAGFHKVKISSAIVSSKIINENGLKQYLLDSLVHEGNSGGPVIDLHTGYIFGVISGRFNPRGHSGVYIGNYQVGSDTTIAKVIPIEYVIDLLKEEKVE